MTTPKQTAANRRNAEKSTGPRTPAGKAVTRLNALRHGATAETVVIPFLEDAETWEEHRQGILSSLSPVGHLESILAARVAVLLWRLGRASRYEREMISISQETREAELLKYTSDSTIEHLRDELQTMSPISQLLTCLNEMDDDKAVTGEAAVALLWHIDEVAEKFSLDESEFPGIDADATLEDLTWTAGFLRQTIAAMAEREGKSTDELFSSVRINVYYKVATLQRQLEAAVARLDRSRREHLLPEPKVRDTLARYEAHLDRSLYKALHELQRLQAARAGQSVPLPVAIDVNLDANTGEGT